jgi:hypothetical protein
MAEAPRIEYNYRAIRNNANLFDSTLGLCKKSYQFLLGLYIVACTRFDRATYPIILTWEPNQVG